MFPWLTNTWIMAFKNKSDNLLLPSKRFLVRLSWKDDSFLHTKDEGLLTTEFTMPLSTRLNFFHSIYATTLWLHNFVSHNTFWIDKRRPSKTQTCLPFQWSKLQGTRRKSANTGLAIVSLGGLFGDCLRTGGIRRLSRVNDGSRSHLKPWIQVPPLLSHRRSQENKAKDNGFFRANRWSELELLMVFLSSSSCFFFSSSCFVQERRETNRLIPKRSLQKCFCASRNWLVCAKLRGVCYIYTHTHTYDKEIWETI